MYGDETMISLILLLALRVPEVGTIHQTGQTAQHAAAPNRWLLGYVGKNPTDLPANPQFHGFLVRNLPNYEVPVAAGPLSRLITESLSAGYLYDPVSAVTVESNRFVSITNATRGEADLKTLLWCDTAQEMPEAFFVLMWMTQSDNGFTGSADLEIYTKRPEGYSSLPPQFISSIHALMQKAQVTTIDQIKFHNRENQTTSLPPSVVNTR